MPGIEQAEQGVAEQPGFVSVVEAPFQFIEVVAPRSTWVERSRCGTRPRVGRWLGEQARGTEAEPCLKPSRQCGGGHPTTSCAASQSAVTVTKGTADRSVVPTTTRSR